MASTEDTEITLGVGKLLGLFFLLAAICGVFFSIGYSMGRSSGREQAANDQAQTADASATSLAPAANKPSPEVVKTQDPAAAAPNANPQAQQPLTFYKAVQENSVAPQPTTATPKPGAAAEPKTIAEATPPANAGTRSNVASGSPEVISHTSPVTGPGTIVVQIAALSREDDAVSLAGALRKKNYNVFVVNNPINNDKFYHVQVGPFSSLADAQAMKARLVAEGYNPIIKR
jgi:cell division septation protein DedD